MSKVNVNCAFDAGSIEVVDISNLKNLSFRIRKDTNSHFAQWFFFQLNQVKDEDLTIKLIELSKTAYPDAWQSYNICASYDKQYWFRVPSILEGDTLITTITPENNSIYFAYFEPFSYERHLELISSANLSPLANHEVLGQTHQGRNIDLLVVGNSTAKHKIWIIARQHPGETMAEWFMEGLIHRLLDEADSICRDLLKDCVFYLVPNMNPDGGYNGNLRTNSVGTNLNREWMNPTPEKSPEVVFVKNKMLSTGIDAFFDIHGDEKLPYIFTAGCEENPAYSDKQKEVATLFKKYFLLVNPDYQTKHGYEIGQFSKETTTLATKWIGNEFDCLALTLEMPFKDNDNLPDKIHGWDGRRSYLMGESLLTTLNLVLKTNKIK